MHRLLLKIFSVALVASLGIGANAKLEKYKSVSSPDVSKRIVADKSHRFRIRTITAGVNLKNTSDLATVESAIGFLQKAKKKFEDEGYEIQTLRIATQPLPGGLSLADLRAGYGSAVVLDGVSFDLEAQAGLAVLGRNGVGKSTLLLTIMGYTQVSRGRVLWRGKEITYEPPHRRARTSSFCRRRK